MRVVSIDIGYRNLAVCVARWCPATSFLRFESACVTDALDGRKPRSHADTCDKVLRRLDTLLPPKVNEEDTAVVIERQHRGVNIALQFAVQGYFFPHKVHFLPPKHKFLTPARLGIETPSADLKKASTEILESLIFAPPQNLCLRQVALCHADRRKHKLKVDDLADACIQLLSHLEADHGIFVGGGAGGSDDPATSGCQDQGTA
jgi:hypothetical protein